MNKWVTLSNEPSTTPDANGFYGPLSPPGAWAEIQPLTPGPNDRTITHAVRMRFHPQVTMDTRIVYTTPDRTRELFVRGFQIVDMDEAELRLICEEIIP